MSAPSIEATMPAEAVPDLGGVLALSAPARIPVPPTRAEVPAMTSAPVPEPVGAGLSAAELAQRLTVANQRTAELEERLAAATAALDTAEHRVAQLDDRNRELASDLDNALDQLAGHALHAEQERLIHTPAWSPWTASADRDGMQR